jgi:hypothetical protein
MFIPVTFVLVDGAVELVELLGPLNLLTMLLKPEMMLLPNPAAFTETLCPGWSMAARIVTTEHRTTNSSSALIL